MDVEALFDAANARLFEHLGVPATYTIPGTLPRTTTILIERNAEVSDARGVVVETRCEVGLLVCEVGEGVRGASIRTASDCWLLLELISADSTESRWVAGRG